jgi:AmmeMemoRadiSam system protein B
MSVRPPAVAGTFYEGDPERLRRTVTTLLSEGAGARRERFSALLLPHAGHVYSGRIAAIGVGAVSWPRRVLLLGPNHRGTGAGVAVSPASAWRTPLGDVPVDAPLAEALTRQSRDITWDARAHAQEHAIEVILPFLQVARPDLTAVCVSLGEPDLGLCLEVGRAVANVVAKAKEDGDPVAVVVSSDLSHYLPRALNRAKDDRALDALAGGDPVELFGRVLERERITMCGILPATALLESLRLAGGARAEVLAHGDSSDAFGDESRVVGYASVLWS